MKKYSKKIEQRVIDINKSIIDSLLLMERISTKLLLVFKENSFKGVVSIGDIQRLSLIHI